MNDEIISNDELNKMINHKPYITSTPDGRILYITEEEFNILRDKKVSLPSKRKMIKTAMEAAGALFKEGIVKVSKEEHERRHGICLGCEYLINKRCLECGCFIKFKSSIEAWHCRIGKW